jgi:hypothetical protein
MENELKHFLLLGISVLGLQTMNASAAPLPVGTKLGITQGVGSGANVPCPTGSCFGTEVSPGFVIWTDLAPGTDGGFIVGKAQKCGGQELGDSNTNNSPGELTSAIRFLDRYATFCTDPGGEQNLFDDAGCTGAGCLGKTELKYLYYAWNGQKIPLGSSIGCAYPSCSPHQLAGIFVSNYQINPVTGGAWSINYSQVVPANPPTSFSGVNFFLLMRGTVEPAPCSNCNPLVAKDISLVMFTPAGDTVNWTPIISNPDGNLLTCSIVTPPAYGTATVSADCSGGTYTPNPGFSGNDSFTYKANNGLIDSAPGVVSVTVLTNLPPTAFDFHIEVTSGTLVTWRPSVDDSFGTVLTCMIGTAPTNGTATVASDCSSGTYQSNPGFIGTDSFTYIANDGQLDSNPGTVTVAVTEPVPDTICTGLYPVTRFTQTGKQGSLTITFTGNITSHTNKEVKVCPGTTLSYTASSTKDVVKCKVKNSLNSGSGTLRIRDHLKCTDKPGGKDKVQLKVKSGVTK